MCIAHAIKDIDRPLWLLNYLYEGRKEMKVLETADKKGTRSIASTHRESQSHKRMKGERILSIFKGIYSVCRISNVIRSYPKVRMLHTTS